LASASRRGDGEKDGRVVKFGTIGDAGKYGETEWRGDSRGDVYGDAPLKEPAEER
jgi:hypothetical protein